MKKRIQTPIALAAAVALALSGPMNAMAGHDDYGKHGNGHYSSKSWGGHGHHGKSWKHRGHKGHYGKHYYRGGHGHGHSSSKRVVKHKYKYDDDDDGEKFLIGLLFGGITGYALSQSSNQAAPVYESYTPIQQAYPVESYGWSSGSCLQQREYQSKVIVGGRTVDAYGTACLQPDGSWRYGPAELAP